MRQLLALALCLSASMAAAQNWRLATHDDGSYFMGGIYQNPGFALSCGENSPQGLSPMATGNLEPTLTRPGLYRMSFSDEELGFHDGSVAPRTDVMIVVGTSGYTLPGVRFDELFNEWWVDLPEQDPVFEAIATVQSFEIRSRTGITQVDARGFADGLEDLTTYCRRMFAASGKPWQTTPDAGMAPQLQASGMRAAAEAAIVRGCNGPAVKAPGHLLAGNIDGDGLEDVVLDWRGVECRTGTPRPFCGAAACSADVFLSSRFPSTGRAENLLAQGVSLISLSNGNQGVRVGRSMASCNGTECHGVFYWNGSDLVPLP